MSADDVVDIAPASADRRSRGWFRIALPIGGVALIVVAILLIALYSERANRAGALGLSDELLADLQERIAEELTAYFSPATRAAREARSMVESTTITDPQASLEVFAVSALRSIPQIDGLYGGDAGGDFIMVQRGTAGTTDTKLIRNTPGPRFVQWIHRDAAGRVVTQVQDPTDTFDPRTRDWYRGALQTDDVYWTGVYLFFTRRVPGITAAVHIGGTDERGRVFGVDITLSALSNFLASLKIGRHGRTAIIDEAGRIVAASDTSSLQRHPDAQLADAHVDQLDDAALTAAYDRFRVEGFGRRIIEVGGERIVSIASELTAAGRNWTLLLVVPQKDFIGFVASNARTTLWLSLIVVALTSVMAALLVRQGLRTDRVARQLLERGEAMRRQNLAFNDLTRRLDISDRAHEEPVQELTAMLVELGSARRASIWRLLDGGRLLLCGDAFDRDTKQHTGGLRLLRTEMPRFFAALESGEEIDAPDAAKDRRADELHRTLMHPLGTRRLHVLPVRAKDRIAGAIMLEDAKALSDVREFMALAANLFAIRMSDDAGVAGLQRQEAIESDSVPAGERSVASDLILQEMVGSAPGAEVFPSAAVLVVRFSEAATLAAHSTGGDTVIADVAAVMIQDAAVAHNIPYAKLVGSKAVLAAGLVASDTTAISRVADAAIRIRERCLEVLEGCGHSPCFQIGLDCGVTVGCDIGHEPRLFNLWGAAVDGAELLAQSGAGPGTIQVSEAVHDRLRDRFLFRLRGSFYRPQVGSERIFVLGGRQ